MLSPAGGGASFERREVEIREAHRLLELVDPVFSQEDPGHVGLARLHTADPPGKMSWIAEKRHLLLERNLRSKRHSLGSEVEHMHHSNIIGPWHAPSLMLINAVLARQ